MEETLCVKDVFDFLVNRRVEEGKDQFTRSSFQLAGNIFGFVLLLFAKQNVVRRICWIL